MLQFKLKYLPTPQCLIRFYICARQQQQKPFNARSFHYNFILLEFCLVWFTLFCVALFIRPLTINIISVFCCLKLSHKMIHSFECLGRIRIKRLIESKRDTHAYLYIYKRGHTVQVNKSMCSFFSRLVYVFFLLFVAVVIADAFLRSRPQITNRKYSHSVTNKFNAKRKSVWPGLTTRTFPKKYSHRICSCFFYV